MISEWMPPAIVISPLFSLTFAYTTHTRILLYSTLFIFNIPTKGGPKEATLYKDLTDVKIYSGQRDKGEWGHQQQRARVVSKMEQRRIDRPARSKEFESIMKARVRTAKVARIAEDENSKGEKHDRSCVIS
jgi:hypothetical protein